MNRTEFSQSLAQAVNAYYQGDQATGDYLMNGCIKRLSFTQLSAHQLKYLNDKISQINQKREQEDYTGLADLLGYELVSDFPNLETIFQ